VREIVRLSGWRWGALLLVEQHGRILGARP
jgi:hypothetical protein